MQVPSLINNGNVPVLNLSKLLARLISNVEVDLERKVPDCYRWNAFVHVRLRSGVFVLLASGSSRVTLLSSAETSRYPHHKGPCTALAKDVLQRQGMIRVVFTAIYNTYHSHVLGLLPLSVVDEKLSALKNVRCRSRTARLFTCKTSLPWPYPNQDTRLR